MNSRILLVSIAIALLAVGFLLWQGRTVLLAPETAPADATPRTPADAATGAATGEPASVDPAAGPSATRSDATPAAPDADYTVRGIVLSDPRLRVLANARVAAYAGEPSDQRGGLMHSMMQPRMQRQQLPFLLQGEPLATAPVTADGRFTLAVRRPHLRLSLEHDVYALTLPEIVHVPDATRQVDVVLAPKLGGCIRGRLLGDATSGIDDVRLLLDADPMAVMRDPESFLGVIVSATRPGAAPAADGTFVFRGVPAGAPITLIAQGDVVSARVQQPGLEPGEIRDVAVPVRAGSELSVRVVDDERGPVAEAVVRVRPAHATGMTPHLARRSATTGTDGTCRLHGLEREPVAIEASATGRTAANVVVDLSTHEPGEPVELVLGLGGVVTGTVVTPDGAPVPFAHVAHHPNDSVPLIGEMGAQLGPDFLAAVAEQGQRADAEGRFRLTGLADDGAFLVVAAHPDWTAGSARDVHMGDTDVRVVLQRKSALRGIVTAAEDDAPLASFTVSLLLRSFLVLETQVRRESFADAAGGAFTLDSVAPGSYELEITASGRSTARHSVDIAPGETEDAGTVALAKGAIVRGVVVGEDAVPIRGAVVRLRQGPLADNPVLAMFTGAGQSERADGEGRFAIGPLPPGRVQLVATADGFAPGRSERLELAAGETREGVVVVLGHGGTIRGRLLTPDGMPPDAFLVYAQQQQSQATASATLAADGTFRITDLDPGQYVVQAMPHGLMQSFGVDSWRPGQGMKLGSMFQAITDHVVSQRCVVRAGAEAEVTLDASEVAVDGTLTIRVEIGDKALRDGVIELTMADDRVRIAFTTDGTAVFRGLQAGRCRIQVRGGMTMTPIGGQHEFEFPRGSDEHTETVRLPGGELRGRVVDATNGEPLRAALVRLLHEGRAERDDPIGMALTAGDGTFAFTGLADGTYGLIAADHFARGGDGPAERLRGIVVAAGAPTEPVVLRARAAASASVLVTDAGGAPIAGATVVCVDREGHPLGPAALATSGPDGRAWFGGLPSGETRVVGRAPGRAPAASLLQETAPGRSTEFALALPTGVRTTLQAFDRAGQPLIGAALSARCGDGPWLPPMLLVEGVRGDGTFDLGRLCAGEWEFRVTHSAVDTLVQRRSIEGTGSIAIVAPK